MKSGNSKLNYKITLNIDNDAWNWYDACTSFGWHGMNWTENVSTEIVDNIRNKSKEQAYEYIDSYLKQKYIDDKKQIDRGIKFIKSAYKEKFTKACEKLAIATGKPIYRNDFNIYLTTFKRAPYNYYDGMLYTYIYSNRPISTFLHELLHFQFIHYWQYNPKSPVSELSFAEFEWLKESLTIILDEDFMPLTEQVDMGHELHQNFRQELKEFWKSNHNFDKLVDFGLSMLPKYQAEIENSLPISTYEKIKTPENLLEFMSHNIKYGFVGKTGRKYFDQDPDWNNDWYETCIIQNGDELLKTKCGTCWDQVELERKWFSENNYNFKTYFFWFETEDDDSYPTHTILVYKQNDKHYWFENSFFSQRGIHRYDSLDELLNEMKQKHLESAMKNNSAKAEDVKLIKCYSYDEPAHDLGVQEYLDHCTKPESLIELA